ncbi:zinc finger protein 36, C3H1 type-like 1 [Notothenia coriiceps]|uniref:mRNA decay activator protein ZFP36 n=1 Tax=Notothenia coriiceps TaxID=8208 RepID=A0A6I9P0D7_9TELE|nr:PREDICTED: zinc finger protein 36, C3H1 type-like 1 [Notothenia coriiceps]
MPSFLLNEFADLEDMMGKQLLNLDLRGHNRPLSSLSLTMRSPGCIGQPRSNLSFSLTSLSCPPTDSSDSVFLTSSQWGLESEIPLPMETANTNQWAKPGFLAQRSISMVETGNTTASGLGWPGTDMLHSPSDISPDALNTSSSSSSSSVSSSSARYKTEMCRSFNESGLCKYGGKCQFAHGLDELRDLNRHPKYKTEPCRTFHTVGFCPYGMRCHFVHNNEEEMNHSVSRSSSFSSSSSSSIPQQPPGSFRSHRPPLVRHSFSFPGFASAPQPAFQPTLNAQRPPATASFSRAPSASPTSCAGITNLLSRAFLEMDSAFEASPVHQFQPPMVPAPTADPQSPFLPSPDSGCSPCELSPNASPPLGQSPNASEVFPGPLGARSLSYTSLSDQDQEQDRSSSASSISGSESCGGMHDANGRRLAVFSQLSVPEDATGFCL